MAHGHQAAATTPRITIPVSSQFDMTDPNLALRYLAKKRFTEDMSRLFDNQNTSIKWPDQYYVPFNECIVPGQGIAAQYLNWHNKNQAIVERLLENKSKSSVYGQIRKAAFALHQKQKPGASQIAFNVDFEYAWNHGLKAQVVRALLRHRMIDLTLDVICKPNSEFPTYMTPLVLMNTFSALQAYPNDLRNFENQAILRTIALNFNNTIPIINLTSLDDFLQSQNSNLEYLFRPSTHIINDFLENLFRAHPDSTWWTQEKLAALTACTNPDNHVVNFDIQYILGRAQAILRQGHPVIQALTTHAADSAIATAQPANSSRVRLDAKTTAQRRYGSKSTTPATAIATAQPANSPLVRFDAMTTAQRRYGKSMSSATAIHAVGVAGTISAGLGIAAFTVIAAATISVAAGAVAAAAILAAPIIIGALAATVAGMGLLGLYTYWNHQAPKTLPSSHSQSREALTFASQTATTADHSGWLQFDETPATSRQGS